MDGEEEKRDEFNEGVEGSESESAGEGKLPEDSDDESKDIEGTKTEELMEEDVEGEVSKTSEDVEGEAGSLSKDNEGPGGKQDSLFGDKKEEVNGEKEKSSNKDIEKIQEGQLKWAVILMASIILIIVIVPFVNNNFIKQFEYEGIDFQKTQLGEIVFYSARFPVVGVTGQVVGDYAVNLRNDPRELASIPIEVEGGDILFNIIRKGGESVYAPTYISINPFMEVCEDSGIALLTLSGFIRDSGPEVFSAVTDKAYARDNNETQKWCDPLSTVFVVTDGNETKISQIQNDCYELQFKDCEVLQVSERLVLNVLEQYGRRFTVK